MESLQNKIKLLFEKFQDPNYVLSNYYGDNIINKFYEKSDPETENIKKLPLLCELFIEALEERPKHITVQVFIVRLLATIVDNEGHFGKVFGSRGKEIAERISNINSSHMPPSLRVAYVELALASASHESGIKWLLDTESWKHLLVLCNYKQTVFTVRQLYKFTSKFLWKLEDLELESSMVQVLDMMLGPLVNQNFFAVDNITSEKEEEQTKILLPVLHSILSLFSDATRIHKKTLLISLLIEQYNCLKCVYIVLDMFRNEELIPVVTKTIISLIFAKVFLTKPFEPDTVYSRSDVLDMPVMFFNTIRFFVQRRAMTGILDFCNSCCQVWSHFCNGKELSFAKSDGNTARIDLQFLFMQLIPILCYVKQRSVGERDEVTNQILSNYVTKMLQASCEHTAKAAYSIRDLIKELDYMQVALQCVKRLSCMKQYMSNDQATLIFQALYYILKEYDPVESSEHDVLSENYEDAQMRAHILTYVMDMVQHLMKNFEINWSDSLEVLCLYSVVFGILKRPNLSVKFTVASLGVLRTAVQKFKPPNMSLLMESLGSDDTASIALDDIGQLIYTKLHDLNWEIRDSALELLLVCTEISFVKFPPFQKQIIDNKLLEVAATTARCDHERYVRATALRCLAAAAGVGALWTHLAEAQPTIHEDILNLLINNQEGIVRKEAVNALCDINKNTSVSPEFLQKLYFHMAACALSDFHWETQIAALKFWNQVIKTHLSEQGMLDGTFPPVTFSKTNRKIVQLNEREIQKRLVKCLNELSSVGCLRVLVMSLLEDTDSEIMETAFNISEDLLKILQSYKVLELLDVSQSEIEKLNETLNRESTTDANSKEEAMECDGPSMSDVVIDGIVNSNDMALLTNIYQDQMSLDAKSTDIKSEEVKIDSFVTSQMFIAHLKSSDFRAIIEEKRKWKEGIRNISSLLEDALGVYEINDDINSKDCY